MYYEAKGGVLLTFWRFSRTIKFVILTNVIKLDQVN
jgi:hypothetical protein